MRLHLNENTAGCSPAVFEALGRLGRTDAGFYPDYDAARAAVARHLDVPDDFVLLTNGLDEGILAAIGAAFRDRSGGVPETLGVTPAFDMYEIMTTALGGRMVTVPLGKDFAFDPGALRRRSRAGDEDAFSPTRTTQRTVRTSSLLWISRAIASVILFLDEAYADFCGSRDRRQPPLRGRTSWTHVLQSTASPVSALAPLLARRLDRSGRSFRLSATLGRVHFRRAKDNERAPGIAGRARSAR